MVRSLYSGISGLRTHQVGLDVTANNIANVNTVAFKAGRATFKESMVQMLAGPSRPAGNQGGRNPMQIGLGVGVGSIDTMLRQGNLQTTGQITDLALEGRAYFAFSNGSGTFYGRNGGLQLDSSGYLVSPTNGWRLQGKMADVHGNYGPNQMIGDIRIPWGDKAPAKATEVVALASNLNSDSHALGTVTHTNSFLANAGTLLTGTWTDASGNARPYRYGPIPRAQDFVGGGTLADPTSWDANGGSDGYNLAMEEWFYTANRMKVTDLFRDNGSSLGIIEGDRLKFTLADPNLPEFEFVIEEYEVVNAVTGEITMMMPTLEDIRANLQAYLNNAYGMPHNGNPPLVAGLVDPTPHWDFEANDWVGGNNPFDGGVVDGEPYIMVRLGASGGFEIINNSGVNISGLQTTSSRPISKSEVASAFLFPPTIRPNLDPDDYYPPFGTGVNPPVGDVTGDMPPDRLLDTNYDPIYVAPAGAVAYHNVSYTTPGIRLAAKPEDTLMHLFSANGRTLDFTDGDTIEINGSVGGTAKAFTLNFYSGSGSVGSPSWERARIVLAEQGDFTPTNAEIEAMMPQIATTMEDLMMALREAFGLPATDGTIYQRDSVYIKDSSDLVADGIPLGAIVMRGQSELSFALTGLRVVGKQGDPNQALNPNRFSSNMQFTQVQAARNTGVWSMSDIVYDDAGGQHNMVITFTHTGTPGEWLWEATLVGGDQVILGGNRGKLSFAMDGSPSAFTFDDGTNSFRFDPRNGASIVDINLDVGSPGSLLGITQFESPNTTAVKSQDGYGMGKLQEITIGENGEITGLYTNGQSKSLAQIFVAEFNNPAGLLKVGDSMFQVSNNSGHAAMYQPGVGSTTSIKPGALEMSNVELETEFTNMITIQRGYQASARVISTSDQMLQELVQLVR